MPDDAKAKLLKLIDAESNRENDLMRLRRTHQNRAAAFRDALSAIDPDGIIPKSNMATALVAMIDREEKDLCEVILKIEDIKTRKTALELFVHNYSSVLRPLLPTRRPDYDYIQKDLRAGTDIYQARELLRKKGVPMLLSEIVEKLFGNAVAQEPRFGKYANLRGTILGYAKDSKVFTVESRSPHIIGLIEFGKTIQSKNGGGDM